MRSLRQYRLFVTLLVLPVLAVVLIVVLVMALTGGDEELPAAAAPTAAAATVGGPLPTPTSSGVPPIATPIVVVPTQAPVPEATPTPAPTPTEPPVPTPAPAPEGPIEYAVQESDTLFSIASAYGVSVADLVEFNDLPDENFIFVGQVLEVPTDPAQVVERRGSRPVVTTAVVVPSDGLNVRAAPNTDTGAVQYVAPGGSELALTGVVEVIDGIEWREVTDGNWVQAQYLEIGVRAAPTAAPAATAAPEATAAPAPAATATPQATQAPTGDTVQATVVPTAGLNVRSSPDSNASVAYVAPGASELQLTGDTQVVTGVTWWQLTDGNWVQGQFLKFG